MKTNQRGAVMIAVFSVNGQWIITGSSDRNVRLFRADTGECTATMEGHHQLVKGVTMSRDCGTIASCSYDSIKVWRMMEGVWTCQLSITADFPLAVALSHNGELIAAEADNNSKVRGVQVWLSPLWKFLPVVVDAMHTHGCPERLRFHQTMRRWRLEAGTARYACGMSALPKRLHASTLGSSRVTLGGQTRSLHCATLPTASSSRYSPSSRRSYTTSIAESGTSR